MVDDELDLIARFASRAISRGDARPLPGEPAYGFMLRVADEHLEDSVLQFAADLGLNHKAIDPLATLVAMNASEWADEAYRASLTRWTPRVQPRFSFIAEVRVRRDDFTLATRRYCPACLAESAHHRVWFDLLFMAECPLHGVALRDRPHADAPTVRWSWPRIDALPDGESLAIPTSRLPELADTLEGRALRLLGLAPEAPDPFLDPFPFSDVVEGAELIGRLVIGGRRDSMPLIGSPGFEADRLRRAGWDVLRRGPDAVKDLLGKIAAAAPSDVFGARFLFGWAYYNFSFKSGLAHAIRDLMNEVAAAKGRHGRRYADAAVEGELMTVREVVDATALPDPVVPATALPYALVLAMGHALALFEPHDGQKGTPLLMRRTRLAELKDRAAGVVTRSRAVAMLGVSPGIFAEIVLAGHVRKLGTRWEDASDDPDVALPVEDRFETAEIERFLRSIPTRRPLDRGVARGGTLLMGPHVMTVPRILAYTRFDAGEFFQAVYDGGIVVHARTGLKGGLADFRIELGEQPLGHAFATRWLSTSFTREQTTAPDSMSQRQACALLDVNPPTAKILCDLGYLELVPSKDRKDRQKLDRASVEAFAARYAAGKIYAGVVGCQDAKVALRAKAAGVSSLLEKDHPGMDFGKCSPFFDRAEMREAFGLDADPDAGDLNRRGWKLVADAMARRKDLFALWHVHPGLKAMFSTADRLWPITVRYVFTPNVTDGFVLGDEIGSLDGLRAYAIEARLDVGGKAAKDRMDAFEARLAGPLPHGLGASVDRDGESIRASMRAVVIVDDQGLADDEIFFANAVADMPIVSLMLNVIKCSFEDGRREFDAATLGIWPTAFCRFDRLRRRGAA